MSTLKVAWEEKVIDLWFRDKNRSTLPPMLDAKKEEILYKMFMEVDEFCKTYDKHVNNQGLAAQVRRPTGPRPGLCASEIMTILLFYHSSGYKCFQYYYESLVQLELASYFPGLVEYPRFLAQIKKVAVPLSVFAQCKCAQGQRTGIYFADSKKLPVCDNRRIHSNKVFKGIAGRGKSSTGWFYGLKLHMIINNLGEIVQFSITAANVSDNNKSVLDKLFQSLKGKCFADKGYISKYFEEFLEKGVQIVTKIRKNMNNTIMQMNDKLWLRKRAVIESVNDILMTVQDIDHSRHRCPWNAIIHLLAGVAAYAFYPTKPTVFIPQELG